MLNHGAELGDSIPGQGVHSAHQLSRSDCKGDGAKFRGERPMRKLVTMILTTIILTMLVTGSAAAQLLDTNPLVRLDPAVDAIVPIEAKVERLASGFWRLEGPVWVSKGEYLVFSDIPHNTIYKWSSKDGQVSVLVDQADPAFIPTRVPGLGGPAPGFSMLGGTLGNTLDSQGRVVYITKLAHQIMRLEEDGRRIELACQFEGKDLNGVNDLVFRRDGSLYFTDPIWTAGFRERRERGIPVPQPDLPYGGVYRMKDRKLTLLTKEVEGLNGLTFSPDEKYLYLANTAKRTILRFEVQPDGSIDNGKVFIDTSADPAPNNPDGMKVDEQGNVYCACPGGIWIISPEGKHLGTLVFPDYPSNLAFGEADGKSLFVTASTALYRIRLNIPGIRP